MRVLLFIFIVSTFSFGCSSSKKYVQKGNYNTAVEVAVKKLRKKRNSEEDILALEQAYPKANQKDRDRILFLQQEGNPDRWEEIMQRYENLKRRQNLVNEVLPLQLNGRTINYKTINYDKKIIAAKKEAANFYLAHAKKMMETNNIENNRIAYYELLKAKKYNPALQNIAALIQKAKANGTSYVLVTFKNSARYNLSKEFKEDLLSFGTERFDDEWLEYTITPSARKKNNYDYTIFINIKRIEISPEQVKESSFEESKRIQDGWEYELDGRGNVKKDSLGNDIKRKKYKTIQCEVIETLQFKSALIAGTVEYVDAATQRKIKELPVSAENFFEHAVYSANGDLKALKRETRRKIGGRPAPFPTDEDLIYGTNQTLRQAIIDILRRNSRSIK